MDKFTEAYIDCALWASNDESEEPLDRNYGVEDIAPTTLAWMETDCKRFQEENAADIAGREETAGYDFWLTRNGHGAGFWDGDWPETVGERLTKSSKDYGECYLYVGDDGLIYGEHG